MVHQDRMGSRLQTGRLKKPITFSSLFSKLICVYISILIIIISIIFFSLVHAVQSYLIRDTFDLMHYQAEGIIKEFYSHLSHEDILNSKEGMMRTFLYITNTNKWRGTVIWIVDENGLGYKITPNGVFDSQLSSKMSDLLSTIFAHTYIEYQNYVIGDELTSLPCLCLGCPIKVDESTQYAMILCTPTENIVKAITGIQNLMLNLVSIIGSFAFIAIYLVSRQMTKPLKEMNIAAKHIAEGKFNERIQIKGNDEIAQLSVSLNAMAEALDKIEENRRSFIANISHDLRSPLTSIQGFTMAILDGTITPEHQERYLTIILKESQRMITMVNTILNLEQLQEQKIQMKFETFDITEVITLAALGLETKAKSKNVAVILNLDGAHRFVIGDVEYISRVIQNLLDNAFKFVKENGHIILQTKLKDSKLWVSVFNDGPPISEEKQKLIWERFYKEDASRGEDKKGIGLGLVIAKEVIRQHNEVIEVHSKEGEMVEFRFSMTLAPKG